MNDRERFLEELNRDFEALRQDDDLWMAELAERTLWHSVEIPDLKENIVRKVFEATSNPRSFP